MYIHQSGWFSERGGNFFNLLQKEGVPRKGGFPQKRGGGSNPGGNYVIQIPSFQGGNQNLLPPFKKRCGWGVGWGPNCVVTFDDREPPWMTEFIKLEIQQWLWLWNSEILQSDIENVASIITERKSDYYNELAQKLINPSTALKYIGLS